MKMYPLYNSQIQLNEVALNVNHLLQETEFYTKGLGLQILTQSDTEVLLGVGKTPLVRLIQTNIDKSVKESYGLYHLAIHLPTKEALGDFLRHAVHTSLPLIGASDHGYSEAIYLEDTEGNGIEIYRDRPVSEWDIREDGRIIDRKLNVALTRARKQMIITGHIPTLSHNRTFKALIQHVRENGLVVEECV